VNSLVTALAVVLVSASIIAAQNSQAPAPAGKPAATAKSEVRGTIKSIDPVGRTVLLADGTRLMIPESVSVNPV